MTTWCDHGGFTFPSTCFFNSFILPAPSLYFLVCALFTVVRTWNYLPFRTIDSKTHVFLRGMQVVCVLQAMLIIGFAAGSTSQGSLFFATFVEVLAWATCVYILELEVWRLPSWPCLLTLVFFSTQLIVTLIFTVLHAHLSNLALIASILLFALSASLFVFSLCKDQWLRSKNELKRLEVERFSVRRSSGVYYNHPPLTQDNVEGGDDYWNGGITHQRINGSDSSILNAISLTWLSHWFPSPSRDFESVTEPLVEYDPYDRMSSVGSSRRSASNAGSWFGNPNRENIYDSDEDDSIADRSIDTVDRATLNLLRHGGQYDNIGSPIVRSAMDYDIEHNAASARRSTSQLRPSTDVGGSYAPQFHQLDGHNDVVMQPSVSTGVLSRVLSKQAGLNKSHSGKSLAPRGVVISDIDSTSSFNTHQQNSFGSPVKSPNFDTFAIAVQNWGLRRNQRSMSTAERLRGGVSFDQAPMSSGRDRSYGMMESNASSALDDFPDLDTSDDPEHGVFTFASFRSRFNMLGSNSNAAVSEPVLGDDVGVCDAAGTLQADDSDKQSQSSSEHVEDAPVVGAVPADESSLVGPEASFLRSETALKVPVDNVESLNIDCELMQREFGVGAEIEFEITVRRNGRSGHPSVSFTVGTSSSAVPSAHQPDSSKWTIWKTAKEVFNLHASVLSSFGDAAPRRPKLKTVPEQNRSMNGQNTIIPHASIVSDMRNIAAYLTGLLQHQRHLRCSEIYSFLDFDTHLDGTATLKSYFAHDGGVDESSEADRESDDELDRMSSSRHSALLDADVPYVNEGVEALVTSGDGFDSEVGVANRIAVSQERWRKLFTNMRVHLKPTAIAIRCRLFEGVLTGADICKWLVQSQYKYAQDSAEACMIGQELLACSLLMPIICGYQDDHDDFNLASDGDYLTDDDRDEDSDSERVSGSGPDGGYSNSGTKSPRSPGRSQLAEAGTAEDPIIIDAMSDMAMAFSTGAAYLYKYSSKSHSSELIGTSTLLGAFAPSNVVITRWAKRDDRAHGRSGPDPTSDRGSVAGMFDLGEVEKQLEANTEGQGYIHYEIVIKHQNDEWGVWRRYREFEQYSKNLYKCGVKPSMGLPSKRFMSAVSTFGQSVSTQIETRRASLEAFLVSAIESVMIAQSTSATSNNQTSISNAAAALLHTVEFLDDDYHKLVTVRRSKEASAEVA